MRATVLARLKRHLTLARLPILACAGLIFTLFLINLWNFAVECAWPKLRIRSASPLLGVSAQKPGQWSLEAFLAGESQKAFSSALGQKMPVFPISVRAKNQLLYSLFGVSGASGVIIGKNGQLFASDYIDEFCARGAAPDLEAIDDWARRIRDIQDRIEAKGKRFAYLITPSKAARYSNDLPDAPCPAMKKGTPEKLAPYRSALEAHGVTYVDGASLTTAAMPDYPITLFARTGTHWNYLASAIAARELTRALAKDGKASPLPRYDFDWREIPEALGTDRDLLELLNLLWPDFRTPTAAIAGRSIGDCAQAPKIFAVGGSFLVEPLINLIDAPCSAAADYWHYVPRGSGEFTRKRFQSDKDDVRERLHKHPLDSDSDYAAAFSWSNIVLLEENEAVIGHMKQVSDLLAVVSN